MSEGNSDHELSFTEELDSGKDESETNSASPSAIFKPRPDIIRILREEASRTVSLPDAGKEIDPDGSIPMRKPTAALRGPLNRPDGHAKTPNSSGSFWSWMTGVLLIVSILLAIMGYIYANSGDFAGRFPEYAPAITNYATEVDRLRESILPYIEDAGNLLGLES